MVIFADTLDSVPWYGGYMGSHPQQRKGDDMTNNLQNAPENKAGECACNPCRCTDCACGAVTVAKGCDCAPCGCGDACACGE